MTTILLDSPERVEYAQRIIGRLPIAEQAYDCVIEPHKDRRTNQQNRRLFKLHAKAGKEVGLSEGEMHEEMLCLKYGYTLVQSPWGGDPIKRPNERSSMKDKKKFSEFMEFCEMKYISELGVFLGDE